MTDHICIQEATEQCKQKMELRFLHKLSCFTCSILNICLFYALETLVPKHPIQKIWGCCGDTEEVKEGAITDDAFHVLL